jgi:protocatechuate 3,4-dioxygenase beta subunit
MSCVRRRRRGRALAALASVAAVGVLAAAGATLAAAASGAGGEGGADASADCPASTPPNTMTLVAGTPQTAPLHSSYATGLQVALANTDGCAVTSGAAGVPVTFTAPASGASGVFSASAANTVTVGADSGGMVSAPAFTANGIAGSYTVTASSQYGTVTFALTNTAAGTPARLVAASATRQATVVTRGYRDALAVRVLDGEGNPVAGASVTFALTASAAASACGSGAGSGGGTGSGAGASFAGGASEASATSDAAGVATSPALTAGAQAGTFTASASLGSSGSGEPHDGGASTGAVAPALFTLTNLAGAPAKLTPGVGETQSARVGARFPIGLAVTVTDAEGNRVAGTLVSFAAPPSGPSGRFAVPVAPRSRGSRHAKPARERRVRVASVRTNACGVALAPALTANARPGGYVVRASAGRARTAAFALVNEAG